VSNEGSLQRSVTRGGRRYNGPMEAKKQTISGYFDQIAADYARLYDDANLSRYPSGPIRLRKALNLLQGLVPSGLVVDVGCGTGHTALELVRRGYGVRGIDISAEMVERSRRLLAEHAPTADARFEVGDVEQMPLGGGSADGAVALGLIEYLDDDAPLASELARILRPGGAAVIAFRNRLFNLFSLNQYTQAEVAAGTYGQLLDEYIEESKRPWPEGTVRRWAAELAAAAEPIAQAAARPPHALKPMPVHLRQHTPAQTRAIFSRAGFEVDEIVYFHFHALPPAFEAQAGEGYHRAGLAMEVLEKTGVGCAMASAFLLPIRRR